MKPSSLLVLLPAFCEISSVSAAAISDPSPRFDVSVTRESDASTNALETRQHLPQNIRDAIVGVAVVGGFLYGQGVDWYSLSKECAPSKVAEGSDEQRDCGLVASAKVMNTLYGAVGAWATFKTLKATIDIYFEPFGKHKRALRARELEPSLSEIFGNQVRHLGHWSDTSALLSGRDDTPTANIPVFGTTMGGIDMHFALRDFNETSNSVDMRFGFGHGTAPKGLGRRNEQLFFNNFGIDIQMMHMDLPNAEDVRPSQELETSILEQLKCHFRDATFDEINLSACNEMWIQMYDFKGRGTVGAAKLAPFGHGGRSAITFMGDYRGGLDLDYQCMPKTIF